MWFARWIPTFLGFPLGGLPAIQVVGTIEGPLCASLAGRDRGEARSSKPEPNAWPGTAENR